jgi:hypothetical protein
VLFIGGTLLLLLVLVMPLWLAVTTLVANIDEIADLARTILSLKVPPHRSGLPPCL